MLRFDIKPAKSVSFDLTGENSVDMEVEKAVVVHGIGGITSEQIDTIVVLDRSEYESLKERPSTTLYLLRG